MSNIQIVRYGELKPCKTAFIDTHTPGSDKKENFTIIGKGVSESKEQFVHINQSIGFNIGAASQPPKCTNSLHTHTTAEVFFVLKGRWRFFWGRFGTAGEVVLEEGDIFNIPTSVFRGFENIGNEYGTIMAILGGDDAGGGVIWAPEVIQKAQKYGLILGEDKILYDTKKGEQLPDNVNPMPLLNEQELKQYPEPSSQQVIKHFIARYWDLVAMAHQQPISVIGHQGVLIDRPGFEVDFLTQSSESHLAEKKNCYEVLMPVFGHWSISADGIKHILNPGDTCLIEPNTVTSLKPAVSGRAAIYRIRNTADKAGPTWKKL